ncbi:hypothetical protein ABFX02_05G022000 [Erythranthe guttata]
MARQIIIVALIFFAVVGMASAAASPPTTTPSTDVVVEAPTGNGDDGSVIGTISGGGATDAAPVGGPVPDGVFPDLTPAPAPMSGAAALPISTVAGAVAAASFVGAFFF